MSLPVLLYTLHCGNMYGTERMALATLEALADYRKVVLAPPADSGRSLVEVAAKAGHHAATFSGTRGLRRRPRSMVPTPRALDVVSTSVRHNLICSALGRALTSD